MTRRKSSTKKTVDQKQPQQKLSANKPDILPANDTTDSYQVKFEFMYLCAVPEES